MKSPRNKLLKNIGLRVKELRSNLDLTQEALAEKVQMHRTYIARIEGGDAMQVSVVKLERIAEALDSKLLALFEAPGEDVPKRVDPPKKFSRGRVSK